MKDEIPILSIIIPTYNSNSTIERCINSIIRQVFSRYEIIIIDGLSTDHTLYIVKRLLNNNSNFKIISEPDRGIYDAMNKGIRIAKGNWVYFLGSDDYLIDEYSLSNIFENVGIENYDICYGNVIAPDYGGLYGGRFDYNMLDEKNICHQAIFYKKDVFKKIGVFNLKYKLLADYDFNIRCFYNKNIQIQYIDSIVAFYSPNGKSANLIDKEFEKDKSKIFFRWQFHNASFREKLILLKKYLGQKIYKMVRN